MHLILALALLGLCPLVSAEDSQPAQPKQIQHDPFKKPPILQAMDTPETIAKPVAAEEPNFKLTAILQAGGDSMVSVQGKTLQLGEQIDGYTLMAVDERSAVFSKGKKTVVLAIDKTDGTTPQ
jgi:hypothetical protein